MSRSIAATVREAKERRPADYCTAPGCLWRVKTNAPHSDRPCPKHTPHPDTLILERLIAVGEVGPVRFYPRSGWSYNATIYPDARSALAAFMAATNSKVTT
jgi:hypothetical protein